MNNNGNCWENTLKKLVKDFLFLWEQEWGIIKAQVNDICELDKESDRKKLQYWEYLDKYATSYMYLLLPQNQMDLLNTIIWIYIEKVSKENLDFKDKKSKWILQNNLFLDKLKDILDNLNFEWIKQKDLSLLLWVNENDISGILNDLIKKWYIYETWVDEKNKFFKIKDIDFVWLYIMKYI